MENIFINIIKFILSVAVGIIAVYLIARLISYAAAKSWYQAKRNNEEETKNGKEKKEDE